MLKIQNDKLVSDEFKIDYRTTHKKSSGRLNKKFLVIHYTAGLTYEGDLRVLSSSSAQASCHLVLGPEGEVGQVGDFNDVLWHAGRSSWKGLSGLNRYSIGIEVTSPGWVTKDSNGVWRHSRGSAIPSKHQNLYNYVRARHENGGPERWWAGFTDAQNERLLDIGSFLMKEYNLEVVGHDQIAPSRKIDPGPCMSDNMWRLLRGGGDRSSDGPDVGDFQDNPDLSLESDNEVSPKTKRVMVDGLNFRAGPGTNYQTKGKLPINIEVKELRRSGNWSKVETPAGYIGWVHNGYLD